MLLQRKEIYSEITKEELEIIEIDVELNVKIIK